MTNTIGFPKLGIELDINRVAFEVFGRPIYWYALLIMTGFILAVLFVLATCKKRGLAEDHIFDIAFYGLLFGILGARLYYVLFDIDCLDGNILNFFKIWEGGLAIYGGIIAAVITAGVYCKIKKISILNTFDVCCPGLFIGQAIGRWGNFVNAEVYGKETSSVLGMTINGMGPYQPLFLYESLWNSLGFILLVIFRDKKTSDGQVFFGYILWYGIGRLLLEGMRQSEYILYVIDGVLGISQLVSAIAIIVAIVGFIVVTKRGKKTEISVGK